MCRITFSIIGVLVTGTILAQQVTNYVGSRSSGMADANINNADSWSLFNNPAGLGYLNQSAFVSSYQSRMNLEAFQTLAVGYVLPSGPLVSGIHLSRFGDEIYSQQTLGVSIGSRLQIISLGLNLEVIQHRFDEFGTTSAFVVDFGGIAEIVEGLRIGAHVTNVNQAAWTENQPVPTIMRIGLSYLPNEFVLLTAELEKPLEYSENLKLGLSYKITDWAEIQTGFNSQPRSFSFGTQFAVNRFGFGYAFSSREPAGSMHEWSLIIITKRNNEG